MAPAKNAADKNTGLADEYTGMERSHDDELSKMEKARLRFPWFDHLMRMQDRYSEQGGNHFAAGITYFSVLSLIPIMLIVFAGFGFVLAGNDAAMDKVEQQILDRVRVVLKTRCKHWWIQPLNGAAPSVLLVF